MRQNPLLIVQDCIIILMKNVRILKTSFWQVRDEYLLVLTLTDGRLGDGNFITQSLLLLVEDVNDNEPVFKPYQTSLTVPEDAEPGVLTTVEATDLDEGAYGQVRPHPRSPMTPLRAPR